MINTHYTLPDTKYFDNWLLQFYEAYYICLDKK